MNRCTAVSIGGISRSTSRLFSAGRHIPYKNASSSGRLRAFSDSFFTSMAAKGMVVYRHRIMGIYHILLMVIWSRNSMVLTQPSRVSARPASQ